VFNCLWQSYSFSTAPSHPLVCHCPCYLCWGLSKLNVEPAGWCVSVSEDGLLGVNGCSFICSYCLLNPWWALDCISRCLKTVKICWLESVRHEDTLEQPVGAAGVWLFVRVQMFFLICEDESSSKNGVLSCTLSVVNILHLLWSWGKANNTFLVSLPPHPPPCDFCATEKHHSDWTGNNTAQGGVEIFPENIYSKY